MDREELFRLVETLHKDKAIDREIIFQGIEAALLSVARRHFVSKEVISIKVDRQTGEIVAMEGDKKIDPAELGRISAHTAKQIMIQKIREAERDVIYQEFFPKKGTLVTGVVQRMEGPNVVAMLGKAEAFLPKSEQIPGEVYRSGERLRALILDVKKVGQRVKLILSRNHPDLVRKLFELEVPEIAEGIIRIKTLAREAGYRTKIAVISAAPNVDCVGACVGIRGTRIKNIVDELGGEKIDIIRWDEAPEILIPNTLKPAEITGILLSPETKQATVVVPEDQLSLAIGKRGQNVRLASKLIGWDIDIVTEQEYSKSKVSAQEAEKVPLETTRQGELTPVSEEEKSENEEGVIHGKD
ncbi:MAG TPA: transcription termination factor NusA [Candidatus Hypogeohydataceae bacterium YC41]